MTDTEAHLGALLRAAAPVGEPLELDAVEAAVGRRARARATAVAAGTVAAVVGVGIALVTVGPWGDGPGPATRPDGAVAWVDRAPSPYVPPSTPGRTTDARPCTAADLRVGKVSHDGAAGGHLLTSVTLTNVSDTSCLLDGDPDVVAASEGAPDVRATPGAYYSGPGPADAAPGESTVLTLDTTTLCESHVADLRHVLRVTLPGGVLEVADPDGLDVGCGLAVAPFDGPGPAAGEPADPMSLLQASLDAPSTLADGAELVYVVTLTNPTDRAIALDRCPSYVESLEGATTVKATYALRCPAAIAAGSSVRFEMRLPASGETASWLALSSRSDPSWPVTLRWALDAPFDVAASAPLTLVAAG